ncbi:MAG: hypothetical protein K0R17_2470 [Rariglobus sp.]|jgi:hypothetical protein|nr:hypothetical protein [Rariglobus sp.]
MTKRLCIVIVCILAVVATLLLFKITGSEPRVVPSTVTDEAFGIIAARKLALNAPGASLVLIAYANDDGAPGSALRRRDAFLREAASSGLRVIIVVSPIFNYKGKIRDEDLLTLPFRGVGIDATSIRHALTHRPPVIVSLEGFPPDLARLNLGATRFFAADPYMTIEGDPLVRQGILRGLLTYREDADWSQELTDPEAISAARFRYLAP